MCPRWSEWPYIRFRMVQPPVTTTLPASADENPRGAEDEIHKGDNTEDLKQRVRELEAELAQAKAMNAPAPATA